MAAPVHSSRAPLARVARGAQARAWSWRLHPMGESEARHFTSPPGRARPRPLSPRAAARSLSCRHRGRLRTGVRSTRAHGRAVAAARCRSIDRSAIPELRVQHVRPGGDGELCRVRSARRRARGPLGRARRWLRVIVTRRVPNMPRHRRRATGTWSATPCAPANSSSRRRALLTPRRPSSVVRRRRRSVASSSSASVRRRVLSRSLGSVCRPSRRRRDGSSEGGAIARSSALRRDDPLTIAPKRTDPTPPDPRTVARRASKATSSTSSSTASSASSSTASRSATATTARASARSGSFRSVPFGFVPFRSGFIPVVSY